MVPDALCRAVDAKIKKKHDWVNGATSFDSVAVGRPNVKKPTNTALRKSARLEAFIILLSDHVRFAQIAVIHRRLGERAKSTRTGRCQKLTRKS